MYVRDISIRRFRHLHEIELGPFGPPGNGSDLVVLAGPNGGGKSSIFDLLAQALSSAWSLGYSLVRNMPESSFEVALAISDEELGLIDSILAKRSDFAPEAVEYLRSERTVYRAFNYAGGRYDQNQGLQNQAYHILTSALREEYQRSLGFFLRADRHYPNKGFQPQSIFSYASTRQKAHAWSLAFNLSDAQYSDIYDFIVQQRYHYFNELGAHQHARQTGKTVGPTPSDPLLPYNSLLGQLFAGYSFTDEGGGIPSELRVDVPPGLTLSFNDLSSGEKEVFFILSFFLRHDVRSAIIMIDEPELHLHPELARRLLKIMRSVRPGNQIWAATHNAEILDEAGRDRVTYISRDQVTRNAVVTRAADEEEELQVLRDLFGYSGYIGVARTMVFLEGEELSTDRKLMSALLPGSAGASVKFIPAGGVESHTRLNAAILKLIEASFGYIKFYLIRDRDFLTDEMVTKYKGHSSGRIHVLDRYHIENYLLDSRLIQSVVKSIWEMDFTLPEIDDRLRTAAAEISSEVASGMFSYRMNALVRPQDFSIGSVLKNQNLIDLTNGQVIEERQEIIRRSLSTKAQQVQQDLDEHLSAAAVDLLMNECIEKVRSSFSSDAWRTVFPGRRILERFATNVGIRESNVFQNSLVKELGRMSHLVPAELRRVLQILTQVGHFPGSD